jgi:hypothetical protein
VKHEASVEASDRPSKPQFVLGVDLDGACVDFYGKLREIAADWLDKPIEQLTADVTYGLPEWGLDPMGGYTKLHRYAVTQRGLFLAAPPIPGAPASLRRLNEAGIPDPRHYRLGAIVSTPPAVTHVATRRPPERAGVDSSEERNPNRGSTSSSGKVDRSATGPHVPGR